MFINLSDVISEQHKPIDAVATLEMNEFVDAYGSYPIVHKEPIQVHVEHVKDKEFLITFNTWLECEIPCARCLQEVKQRLDINGRKHIDLGATEVDLNDDFDESVFINGYNLDVDKLLYNEILASWPTKVLCTDDCQGICSVCGQNLNEGACSCEDTGLDPRMSVVRDLFKNIKEV